ncbi:hypothetical protein A2757_00645 [Candidatus Giovannonibacteria bacterium RIFCSPHIGHO2_01_FULL_48_47]|nr:MAG: hypothetical protein A2757_00645 [Candidatus Giovannonibacteria bacterium RIFCSPHIGHO2_01_FULL_48_47]OGF68331.1 MAG: hypothetical protein A3D61_00410 [Candidatus Giovannonibacteria bacterium RIFCSPHIGHO2_02_FULL_48_15]OGF87978.1 MAG: hypothetical protein A3B26_03755 [Candidatus Giovannonibacteria bacterium RIFCSPLOWO2_01_FULL_48_47]OGF94502.1 MAG: hypothetical protein A2433_01180 [Candidatus Giovannonibacteria bacterium RIFOXYC1_FULL_48_8]OGF96215.1 MAG: hypothetical protein A2613_01440
MENFDPVGGGFLVERILDAIFSFSGGGAGSGALSQIFAILKVIGEILFFVFVGGIIFVMFQLRAFRPRYQLVYRPSSVPQQKLAKKRWEDVMQRFEQGLEADWRLAIIEADSLVDEIFQQIGFGGENLGERMSAISPQELRSIVDLREAHQLRNKIVHTPGYKISRQEAERVLRKYQKILEELEVI